MLESKNDQMTFQKKKAAFFNCVHEAYMCLVAGLPRWGQLALGPKLIRPAICKIKGECKVFRGILNALEYCPPVFSLAV